MTTKQVRRDLNVLAFTKKKRNVKIWYSNITAFKRILTAVCCNNEASNDSLNTVTSALVWYSGIISYVLWIKYPQPLKANLF